MTIEEIMADKEEVLGQAYTLIEEAIENDPKYSLSTDELAELVYEMMYRFATQSNS